ncbi:MAG: hypothetical protein IT363_16235 [Methanoregulaceae archaeon]|nr:hypothetical protein [Methanoregulaceae archaeon]
MQASLLLMLALAGNDDRDVIQAALLSFYKKEIWHAADWEPKQPIQVLDKFAKDEPTSMELTLRKLKVEADSAVARTKKESKTSRDKEYLLYYERTSQELGRIIPLAKQKGSSAPSRLVDFRDVTWRAGIQLVDRITRDYSSGPVSARASKPRYSPNGQFAWVQFSMPWSIHSADVQFVLEKREGTWHVRVGWARFYV